MLKHVAFIMDGNRKWARSRKLPSSFGYKKGYQRIEEIIEHAGKRGISYVTFWAFSTENWKRTPEEIDQLMNIFRNVFRSKSLQRIANKNVRINILGDLDKFPEDIQINARKLITDTAQKDGLTVNIALNYGGRQEIIRAVNQLLQQKKDAVDEETFSSYLYTQEQPDPDLIIRTGGEQRLSGYLPWQSIYSELYFTKKYWPEFDTEAFDEAIDVYNNRDRRFGK